MVRVRLVGIARMGRASDGFRWLRVTTIWVNLAAAASEDLSEALEMGGGDF